MITLNKFLLFSSALFLALVSIQTTQAQKINYNKIIPPQDSLVENFEEKLVQLAWQNFPQNKSKDAEVQLAYEKLKESKWLWLSQIGVGLMVNSQPTTPQTTAGAGGQIVTTTTVIPRVGFGFNIGIGAILLTPFQVKKARYEFMRYSEDYNVQKTYIRYETLKRYNEYRSQLEVLKYQVNTAEQARTVHTIVEKNFSAGTAKLEDYHTSFKFLSDAEEKVIVSRYNLQITKAQLEQIIGVKLEEVNQ